MALDIGPKSIELFTEEISTARQPIIWNGSMGVFEVAPFSKGTFKVARAVAENGGATSIVGAGIPFPRCTKRESRDKITHISTGGGASLEFLEGKKLPGVEALMEKNNVLQSVNNLTLNKRKWKDLMYSRQAPGNNPAAIYWKVTNAPQKSDRRH